MYGSCQRSAGLTPRYALAAALMMARSVATSSSRHRRMVLMAATLPVRIASDLGRNCRLSERQRTDAELPHEAAMQMALVVEPGDDGRFRKLAARTDEPPRQCHALLQDVSVR